MGQVSGKNLVGFPVPAVTEAVGTDVVPVGAPAPGGLRDQVPIMGRLFPARKKKKHFCMNRKNN